MPVHRESSDVPANQQVELCEACGKHPSGCAAWGHRLCYGDKQTGRVGCIDLLASEMSYENEEAFTQAWVSERKARRRAA